MSRNASGVYSLPSDVNPVVSLTTITTNWANSTLSDIGSEITNSLDRGGRGAMTAPLQLPDGTAAAPSLTFSNDTNTGLYRVGADQLGISAGGTLRGTWGTGGLTIANALLAADGAVGTPSITFSADTNTGIYRAGADDLRIAANGTDIAKVTTKLSASAATAATGGTRQDALSLTNGDLDLSAVTAPTSTTAVSNRLTPSNICKAWVVFNLAGGGGGNFTVTVQAAFNITSVAFTSSTSFTITFASAFSSATNYGPLGQVLNGGAPGGGADVWVFNPTTRGTTTLVGTIASGTGLVDLNASSLTVQVMVACFGLQ